ncbi:PAS domain S-box protein [Flavobacteriaceae bacterium LMO-SS05]
MRPTIIKKVNTYREPLEQISVILASLIIVLAVLVLIGWAFDMKSLSQPISTAAAMNPFSAICFIFQGLGFILLTRFKKINILKVAGIIMVLMSLVLASTIFGEIIFKSNTRLDAWLFQDKLSTGVKGFSLSYMAVSSALSFVMTGIALLPLIHEKLGKWFLSQFLACAVGFIAMLALLGYIYNIELFYRIPMYYPMSILTTICFLFMAHCILFSTKNKGLIHVFLGSDFGSIMARKLIPAALILPVALGFIRLYLERKNIINHELGVGFMVMSSMVVIIFFIWISARELNWKDTLRKEAILTTAETVNRLELATKSGNVGIWEWDIINNKFIWDKQMCALYDIADNSFDGTFKSWIQTLHPEDAERVPHEILTAIKKGEEYYNSEFRVVWPDLSIKTINTRAKIERNKKGKALRLIGTNWDISERVEIEEELRENNVFLDAIFENLPNMLFVKDAKDSSYIRVNRVGEKLLGYKQSDLMGKNDYDLFPKEQADFFVNTDKELIKNGKLFEIKEEKINTPHGERRLRTKKIPIYNKNGLPSFILGISEDITEQKRLEEELKKSHLELEQKVKVRTQELSESENKLQSLFENAPVSIAIFDLESSKFVKANKNASLLFKYSPEQLAKMTPGDISPKFQPDGILSEQKIKENVKNAMLGKKVSFEWMHRDAERNLIPCEVHLVLLPNTERPQIYAHTIDITERTKTREKLKQHYKELALKNKEIETRLKELNVVNSELQKINSELDRFVYSASHDLRSPLKSLLGLSDLVIDDIEPENTAQLEHVNMMKKSIIKLDNFIEDILEYSRNARTEVAQEFIDFKALIQDVTSEHNHMAEAKEITLNLNIDQNLKFVSDKRRLNVVLNNLISNAIKYRDLSKECPFVTVDIKCDIDEAIIRIQDNGIGIDTMKKDKIFEMFYRATRISRGSGLGLYIVKEALDNLNGTIKVESELHKGTLFTVNLPNQLTALN